jgi:hypothetical protein
MNSIICTLYEKDYHWGVAGLINSLFIHGYQGKIYIGCKKSDSIPFWIEKFPKENDTYIIENKIVVKFLFLSTNLHFTNYKPHFLLDVMNTEKDIKYFYYFDPDIVIVQPWRLFEAWIQHGIAVCQDVNFRLPSTHVSRHLWVGFSSQHGYTVKNKLDYYVNGGFVGITRENTSFIEQWKSLIDLSIKEGLTDINNSWNKTNDYSKVFGKTEDQDILNLTLMLTDQPISVAGPDAMGFYGGRIFMYHTIGGPKPWQLTLKHLFTKRQTKLTVRIFYNYIYSPINISRLKTWKQNIIFWFDKFKIS